MIALWRLGSLLAWGSDKDLRLRSIAVLVATIVATICALTAIEVAGLADDEEERIVARSGQLIGLTPEGTPLVDPANAPLRLRTEIGSFEGRQYPLIYLAAQTGNPPLPPGLERVPDIGEFAVSPALDRLLDAAATDNGSVDMSNRFILHVDGVASGQELIAWTSAEPGEDASNSIPVLGFGGNGGSLEERFVLDTTFPGLAITTISVGLLLIPALTLVFVASNITAPARRSRFALFERLGLTRAGRGVVAATEAVTLALPGALFGALLGSVVLSRITQLPLLDVQFLPGSLAPSVMTMIISLTVVTIAAVVAAMWSSADRSARPRSKLFTQRAEASIRALPIFVGAVAFWLGASGDSTGALLLMLFGVLAVAATTSLALPHILRPVGQALAWRGGATRLCRVGALGANHLQISVALAALSLFVIMACAVFAWIVAIEPSGVDQRAGEILFRPGAVQNWLEWGLAVCSAITIVSLVVLVSDRSISRRPDDDIAVAFGTTPRRVATIETIVIGTALVVTSASAMMIGALIANRMGAFGKSERMPWAEISILSANLLVATVLASVLCFASVYSSQRGTRPVPRYV